MLRKPHRTAKNRLSVTIVKGETTEEEQAKDLRLYALAVIHQAMKDASGEGLSSSALKPVRAKLIADAKAFLSNSADLKTWCLVAGLSKSRVMKRSRELCLIP